MIFPSVLSLEEMNTTGLVFVPTDSGRIVMLVLSRKLGEKIVIGEGIELMVVAVNGNRVRLGIAAPEETRIMRSERCEEPHRAPEPLALAGCHSSL